MPNMASLLLPTSIMNNTKYRLLIYPVLLSNPRDTVSSSFVFTPHFSYLFPSKLRVIFIFSNREISLSPSSFSFLVSKIFRLTTGKEVFRVNTRRIVASMTNIQPLRYSTFMDIIRYTVSKIGLIPVTYNSIALIVKVSNPNPTVISLNNLIPKPFFNRSMVSCHA